jgi:hypothetical protein
MVAVEVALPPIFTSRHQGVLMRRGESGVLKQFSLRHRYTAVGFVSFLFAVASCISACTDTTDSSTSNDQNRVPETRIVTLKPWTDKGLTDGFQVRTAKGSCWVSSELATRTDAYRCTIGDVIYDPCFSSQYSASLNKVACPTSPKEMQVIELTDPLPEQLNDEGELQVWMLILGNGDQCNSGIGAGPDPRGDLYLSMTCESGSLIWGNPDKSSSAWTVQASKDEKGPLSTMQVTEVYQ